MYLDDFRIYNKMLKIRDIKILSAPAMNLWAEDFATLGCDSCNYNQVYSIQNLNNSIDLGTKFMH